MSGISVLGIFVADISFSGNKIPSVGETILGNSYNIGPGGKGCNQAIAISRLGGKVNFISKLGKDDYGKLAINKLKKDNIDTSNVIISDKHQTGVAGILVDKNTGKNAINVIVGAPSTLRTDEIDLKTIKNSKIFLTQLEIPKETTLDCLKFAKDNDVITKEFFNYIDYFTPNETEAEFYSGIKINSEKDAKLACEKLLKLGIKKIIITLGEKGLFYSDGKNEIFIAAHPVKAIDTTGAGDAFNGGFAFSLFQEKKITECLEMANKVAGLSTTKLGAGDGMPYLKDIV
jgi:ribokinase